MLRKIISELFFPSSIKCICCDGELRKSNKYCLCDKCDINYNTKFCLTCGRSIQNLAEYCNICMDKSWAFTEARSSLEYADKIKSIIYKFKYDNGKYLAPILAEFMLDTFYSAEWSIDYITYVPLHKKRQKARGYNQAELLANVISKTIEVPVVKLLEKTTNKTNLAKLNSKERENIIADSFSFSSKLDIKSKRVLIIDDVFTTGATTNECAKILKTKSCSDIYVLTFASTKSKILLH